MAVITKTNQVQEAISRLATIWKDKPVVLGLLEAYINSVQAIEDTYDQMLNERGIDVAIGAQLDVLGLIVGQPRSGQDDTTYRDAIKLRVAINNSDGTEPTISTLLQQLTGADTVIFETDFPAGVRITLEGELPALSSAIINDLRDILAVTITAELEYRTFVSPPFVFENDDDGEGFADAVDEVFLFITSEGTCLGFSGSTDCIEVANSVFSSDVSGDGGFLLDSSIINI